MAKYYLDTEFSQSYRSPMFGKKYLVHDLITIGIVCEDGRKYYSISKDFNPNLCNEWVQKNVLQQIITNFVKNQCEKRRDYVIKKLDNKTISDQFKKIQKWVGKSEEKIAEEIYDFVNPDLAFHVASYEKNEINSNHFKFHNVASNGHHYYAQPEFYTYFGDFDWVILCSLFGDFSKHPLGFPMYANDLKQTLDEKAKKYTQLHPQIAPDFNSALEYIKGLKEYPKQTNEHNALSDAIFNMELHKLLDEL